MKCHTCGEEFHTFVLWTTYAYRDHALPGMEGVYPATPNHTLELGFCGVIHAIATFTTNKHCWYWWYLPKYFLTLGVLVRIGTMNAVPLPYSWLNVILKMLCSSGLHVFLVVVVVVIVVVVVVVLQTYLYTTVCWVFYWEWVVECWCPSSRAGSLTVNVLEFCSTLGIYISLKVWIIVPSSYENNKISFFSFEIREDQVFFNVF